MNTTLHVLRVFVGDGGAGGNALGVFLDGAGIPAGRRQQVATDLAFSETMFVDEIDAGGARVAISAAAGCAGHPPPGRRGRSGERRRP